MLSYQNIITYSVDIPLFFYNIPEKASVNAPTHIKALVKGKRKDLALLPFKSSIHCNAEHFTSEPKNLKLKKEHIFLPEGVQLINCSFLSKIFITTSH